MTTEEQLRMAIAYGFAGFAAAVWVGFTAAALLKRDWRRALRVSLGAPLLFGGLFIVGWSAVECYHVGSCFIETWVVAIPAAVLGSKILRGGKRKASGPAS